MAKDSFSFQMAQSISKNGKMDISEVTKESLTPRNKMSEKTCKMRRSSSWQDLSLKTPNNKILPRSKVD